MNVEGGSEINEQEQREDEAATSADNERDVPPTTINVHMIPETLNQIRVTEDNSVHEEITPLATTGSEHIAEDGIENKLDCQKTERSTDDSNTQHTVQFSDLCFTSTNDTWSWSKKDIQSLNVASKVLKDILFPKNSTACDNSSTMEEQGNTVQLPVSTLSPKTLFSPSTQIIITPTSDQNLTTIVGHYEEVLNPESNKLLHEIDATTANIDVVTNPNIVEEVDTVMSIACDTSCGDVGYTEVSDLLNEEISDISTCCERLLISTSEETYDELEADDTLPKVTVNPEQNNDKLTSSVANFHGRKKKTERLSLAQKIFLKLEKKIKSNEVSTVLDRFDPHASMEEIDLNEDTLSHEFQKKQSIVKDSSLTQSDPTKYGDIRTNCSATMNFLKHNVIKGVLAQGVKIKEVVNEKLNTTKQCQDTTLPIRPATLNDEGTSLPPYPLRSAAETNLQNVPQCLIFSAKNYRPRNQGFSDENDPRAIPLPEHAVNYGTNITQEPSAPGIGNFSKTSFSSCKLKSTHVPIHQPLSNDMNKPLSSRLEPSGPFVHSTITQSPGPMRGYTAFNPTPYGVHVPPPLPPPPSVPVNNYFAYQPNRCSTLTSMHCPVVTLEESKRLSSNPLNPPGAKFTKGMDYMASFVRLKSSEMKEDLNRKLSSSVSQMSRGSPLVDAYIEEGRAQRSSMDSGSDQFHRGGFDTITADDLIKGAVCCCFWPIGLAAKLFTMTIPDRGGPVDTCVKVVSRELSSFALLLGIATYFVFFLLWLSLLTVAANK